MRAPNERCETPPLAIGAGAGGASAGVACWYEAGLPPDDPVIIGIECPAAFCSPEAFSPPSSSSDLGNRSAWRTKGECACAACIALLFPSSCSRGQEFFRLSRFFPVEAIYFPSFPSFVLSFFRWFFWQQAINPIIGLAEPLSAPPWATALPYLSLSFCAETEPIF